ncbi:MAG: nucleoside triphosphate pyrophosphohydrolase [Firmicutes bacterium]|nr:nucleoside triphosphate pyrophosphohydrolase [Bacillota bacterium]
MPQYDKLVRDRIPEIIKNEGKRLTITTLEESEYLAQLDRKLQEELAEYLASRDIQSQVEELADILEVVYAIAEAKGVTVQELEEVRRKKAEKKGAFKDKVFLRWVED